MTQHRKYYLVDPMCRDLASHMMQYVKGATDVDEQELAEMLQKVCVEFCGRFAVDIADAHGGERK